MLLLSVGAGILGCWIVLRGLAFYSHAVGSAAFPGLVLADGLGFAAPLGALGAATAFALLIAALAGRERLGPDATTAIGLAGMLALGVILASDVFQTGVGSGDAAVRQPAAGRAARPGAGGRGERGRARGDPDAGPGRGSRRGSTPAPQVRSVCGDGCPTGCCWPSSRSWSSPPLSALGALLVAALVVVPAATVRLWTNRLVPWQAITVALVAVEGIAGLALSVELNAPPGATIAALVGHGVRASAARHVPALAWARDRGRRGGRRRPRPRPWRLRQRRRLRGPGGRDHDAGRRLGPRRSRATASTVHQILKPNTDPHEYEPRPDDVEALADADVIFRSGGDLDDWVDEAADDAGSEAEVVDLSNGLPHLRRPGGELDPHWWHDPRNVTRAVLRMAEALVRAAPEREAQVARRTRELRAPRARRRPRGRALHAQHSARSAQARHRPRRLRLLRRPLRAGGRRHRDPGAHHARAAVGRRARPAGGHDRARARARGVPRELGERGRRRARSPARPAPIRATCSTPTRSGRPARGPRPTSGC